MTPEIKMLLLHRQSSLQGPGTCPADTAACAAFSLVVFPGRSSSWVVPRRPILSSKDTLSCLQLLTFLPLVLALEEAAALGISREMSACFSTKMPRDLSYLSRDFKVELIVTLRSISE